MSWNSCSAMAICSPAGAFGLDLAPATGPVVGDDLPEHGRERGRVDGVPLPEGNRAGGFVAVAGCDDPLRVGDDAAVVEEHVDMILRRQQRTDVALQDEVRLSGALDGLVDLRVGRVDKVPDLTADGTLPAGQGIDVRVHARVGGVGHGSRDQIVPAWIAWAIQGITSSSISSRVVVAS